MSAEVPLYNINLTDEELKSLLDEIRSSSYIDEIESGEVPREESSLWNLIRTVQDAPKDISIDEILTKGGTSGQAIVLANDKSLKSVSIYHVEGKEVVDSMKTAPKDVLEVCSNILNGGMRLSEFKSMANNVATFDSGR